MSTRIAPRRPIRVYLAEWREHFGLTQQQVGDRIGEEGVDKGTVSRWEKAAATGPAGIRGLTFNVVAAYAEALKIPVSQLYRRPGAERSLDEMMADAPTSVRSKIVEIVATLLKP